MVYHARSTRCSLSFVFALTLAGSFGAGTLADDDPPRRGFLHLRDHPFVAERGVDVAPSAPPSLLRRAYRARERGLYLVRFDAPIEDAWREALEAKGARVLAYVPDHALLVKMTPEVKRALDAATLERGDGESGPLRWIGVFEPAYRIAPELLDAEGFVTVNVTLVDDDEGRALAAAIARSGRWRLEPTGRGRFITGVADVPAAHLQAWTFERSLVRIDRWTPPQLFCEVGALNMAGGRVDGTAPGFGLAGVDYLSWLEDRGFDIDAPWDVVVNVVDTGLDLGMAAGTWHQDLLGPAGQSRVLFVNDWTSDEGTTREGKDGNGHGTSCAGVVGGYNDDTGWGTTTVGTQGYRFGLGVAPLARFGASKIFTFAGASEAFPPSLLEQNAHEGGARISSNSWGYATYPYGSASATYDEIVRDARPDLPGNQPMIVVFAAGNSGPYDGTVTEPSNAKNVISVGAVENWWPGYQTGGWPAGMQDTPGDDIAYYSSRGPTPDGRRKPDIVGIAQGWVTLRSRATMYQGAWAPFDTASTTFYRSFNGTSAATPAVAGAIALFYEKRTQAGGAPPSPALVKAALAATARDLEGGIEPNTEGVVTTGTTIPHAPSNSQGWGLVDTDRLLDESGRTMVDQSVLFSATGQSSTMDLVIADGGEPVTIALAYTDAPGVSFAAPWVNDLDLEVDHDGTIYRGNVFANGYSATGGTADTRNNLELVRLPPGTTGRVTVTVRATAVVGDGVPGNGDATDQDFALFADNAASCTPPDAPSGLQATADGDNRIELTWTASGDAVDGYRIYRGLASEGESGIVLVADVGAGSTSYIDETASGGFLYRYRVTAWKECESDPTGDATAETTGACFEAPAFAGVASVSDGETATCSVALAWSAATPRCGSAVWYDVYRATSAPFTPSVATRVAQGVRGMTYIDVDAVPSGVEVFYLVRAVDASNGVADGNVVTLSATASAGTTEAQGQAPVAIPDGDAGGISVVAHVVGGGVVQSLQVGVDVSHQAAGDVLLRLTAPDATSVTLHDQTGGLSEDIVSVFDRDRIPDGPGTMADFAGAPLGGAWTLFAADDFDGYQGGINAWSIELTSACAAGASTPHEASPTGGLRVSKTAGGALQLDYDPAAFATEHALYSNEVAGSFGTPEWTSAICALGATGSVIVDPGMPAVGAMLSFVVAGRDATQEGSYGYDSSGQERPTSSLCLTAMALKTGAPVTPGRSNTEGTTPRAAADRAGAAAFADAVTVPASALALALARPAPRLTIEPRGVAPRRSPLTPDARGRLDASVGPLREKACP